MMTKVQLMIKNFLETEDINILKSGKQIKYGSDMVQQDEEDFKDHTEYLLANEVVMEILHTIIKNRETCMGTNFEAVIASHVQSANQPP